MDYKLSTLLYGHTLDVRGLAVTTEGFILSASRDKTVKLWKPNGINNGYTEVQSYNGHTNFVMCVTVLKPSEILPGGLIVTGSNDKLICGFKPDSPEAVFTETGHTETVCKLNPGVLPNTFISSSWDATARLWQITMNPDQSLETVLISLCNGHSMAVWSAIQLRSEQIVTCSADRTILVHIIVSDKPDKSTTVFKKLTGHTDCVRDLAELGPNEFLSCSNDATIKRWNLLGECVETFYGHPSYIYSLCAFFDKTSLTVVSSGEDRYVNVSQSSIQQVILQPSQSIWAVTVLPNSDIVAGCSDSFIRIFSKDPIRQAPKEALAAFQEQVDQFNQLAQKEIGGIKVDGLPGPEVLCTPGKSDGKIIMVNENGKPICYKWLANESKWEKIGDVLSGSEPSKHLHEGKEYDFIWNVDIEDDKPPLKLPFNRNEDPWLVAQHFINANMLPQSYLETVANFIISNAKLSPDEQFTHFNQSADPYTGGARYVPTNSGEISSKRAPRFPQTDYINFSQGNIKNILSKVEKFNEEPGEFLKLNKSQLNSLTTLLEPEITPNKEIIDLLTSLLDWPLEFLFPVLDITRLALRKRVTNDILCLDGMIMIKLLPHIYNTGNPVNQMLAFRCLCNIMQHEKGELLVVKYYEEILKFINTMKSENFSMKHVQVAIVTFLLNVSVMIKQSDDTVAIQNVTNTISEVCFKLKEPDAMTRGFVAIGTLLSFKNPPVLSEKIRDFIELISSSCEPAEVNECCRDIKAILGNKP